MQSSLRLLCIFLPVLVLSGCLSSSKTEYIDEAKVSVSFENEKAERAFYDGMSKNKHMLGLGSRPQEHTRVSLILVNVSNTKITSGPNRDFNQAVQICDTDKNSTITEKEAEMFNLMGIKPKTP